MQKFNSCFDSQKYKSFVEHDIALGASLGHLLKLSFNRAISDHYHT